jgi:hypothetical protein
MKTASRQTTEIQALFSRKDIGRLGSLVSDILYIACRDVKQIGHNDCQTGAELVRGHWPDDAGLPVHAKRSAAAHRD